MYLTFLTKYLVICEFDKKHMKKNPRETQEPMTEFVFVLKSHKIPNSMTCLQGHPFLVVENHMTIIVTYTQFFDQYKMAQPGNRHLIFYDYFSKKREMLN